jgi:hypothetical protein
VAKIPLDNFTIPNPDSASLTAPVTPLSASGILAIPLLIILLPLT